MVLLICHRWFLKFFYPLRPWKIEKREASHLCCSNKGAMLFTECNHISRVARRWTVWSGCRWSVTLKTSAGANFFLLTCWPTVHILLLLSSVERKKSVHRLALRVAHRTSVMDRTQKNVWEDWNHSRVFTLNTKLQPAACKRSLALRLKIGGNSYKVGRPASVKLTLT